MMFWVCGFLVHLLLNLCWSKNVALILLSITWDYGDICVYMCLSMSNCTPGSTLSFELSYFRHRLREWRWKYRLAQHISRSTQGFDLGGSHLSVAMVGSTGHVWWVPLFSQEFFMAKMYADSLLRICGRRKCTATPVIWGAPPQPAPRTKQKEHSGSSTVHLARQPWFWPCCGLKDTNLRRNLFIMWGIHAILDSIQWARWMICQIGPSHGWIRANLQYNSFAASDTKITFAGFYIQLSDDLKVSREKKSDL